MANQGDETLEFFIRSRNHEVSSSIDSRTMVRTREELENMSVHELQDQLRCLDLQAEGHNDVLINRILEAVGTGVGEATLDIWLERAPKIHPKIRWKFMPKTLTTLPSYLREVGFSDLQRDELNQLVSNFIQKVIQKSIAMSEHYSFALYTSHVERAILVVTNEVLLKALDSVARDCNPSLPVDNSNTLYNSNNETVDIDMKEADSDDDDYAMSESGDSSLPSDSDSEEEDSDSEEEEVHDWGNIRQRDNAMKPFYFGLRFLDRKTAESLTPEMKEQIQIKFGSIIDFPYEIGWSSDGNSTDIFDIFDKQVHNGGGTGCDLFDKTFPAPKQQQHYVDPFEVNLIMQQYLETYPYWMGIVVEYFTPKAIGTLSSALSSMLLYLYRTHYHTVELSKCREIPLGLWAKVLSKSNSDVNLFYYLLLQNPNLVDQAGTSRLRRSTRIKKLNKANNAANVGKVSKVGKTGKVSKVGKVGQVRKV